MHTDPIPGVDSAKPTEQDGEDKVRFVMCPPKYLSTRIPNNVFMEGDKREPVDVPRAMSQYRRFKRIIESFDVEVLEIPPAKECQDQTFVANIAIAIDPFIVLANYKAPGRNCEVPVAKKFFENAGYKTIQPQNFFEGEADLKLWKPGFYFGGTGQFSDQKAFDWISDKCGVTIIPLKEIDERAYHLDCNLFVIDEENVLINRAGLDPKSVRKLERLVNVIEQPKGLETTGITNGVKIPRKPIYCSGTFNPEQKDYRKAMEWLFETMDKFGWSVILIDTDAVDASGADASCTVMHLTF